MKQDTKLIASNLFIFICICIVCIVKAEQINNNYNNIDKNIIIVSSVILFKIDNQLQLETWQSKRLILLVQQSIKITHAIRL